MTSIITEWSADRILAVPSDRPDRLFDHDTYTQQYNKLRLLWHPDKNPNPQASSVFSHVSKLYITATQHDRDSKWVGNAELVFVANTKKYKFKYLKMHLTDTGKMYIGRNKIALLFDSNNEDLFTACHRHIDSIKFPDTQFKKEFDRFLPTNKIRKFKADVGGIVVINKTPDVINLKDLLAFMPNHKLHPKHVAWIVSSIMNVLAFLEHSNKCHNAITTESVFVSMEHHSICLLGGWGFATATGTQIVAVPSTLQRTLPPELFVDKKSKPRYDQYGLKSLAIECLGDPSLIGSKLLTDKEIPKPMINWLRQPPAGAAKAEYSEWMAVLHESFGDRKFFKFTTDLTKLYEV